MRADLDALAELADALNKPELAAKARAADTAQLWAGAKLALIESEGRTHETWLRRRRRWQLIDDRLRANPSLAR